MTCFPKTMFTVRSPCNKDARCALSRKFLLVIFSPVHSILFELFLELGDPIILVYTQEDSIWPDVKFEPVRQCLQLNIELRPIPHDGL